MVSRFPFYRRSSSWLSAVLSGAPRPPAGLPSGSAVESYRWSSLSAAGVSGAKRSERKQRAGQGGGAERSGAEFPLPALYVFPCSFLPLLPALSLPAGRELSGWYAFLSGGSSLSAVSLLAGLGSSPVGSGWRRQRGCSCRQE